MRTDAINLNSSLLSALSGNKTNETATSLVDLLSTDSSSTDKTTQETSAYFTDSTGFSSTTAFFSELRSLEATDPDTYQELVSTLGERLRGARGYAGQLLASLSEQVAGGSAVADVIRQGVSTAAAG